MKYCTYCGTALEHDMVFCSSCGSPVSKGKSSFCRYCGSPVNDGAAVCLNCGCPTNNMANSSENKKLINKLSTRLEVNGIIWIAIAAIQLLCGMLLNYFLLIVGGLNLFTGIQDISFGKTILSNPTGIVKRCEPIAGTIITLVYNAIFGGVIGVAGSIYYLVAIRGFVINSKDSFLQIENFANN